MSVQYPVFTATDLAHWSRYNERLIPGGYLDAFFEGFTAAQLQRWFAPLGLGRYSFGGRALGLHPFTCVLAGYIPLDTAIGAVMRPLVYAGRKPRSELTAQDRFRLVQQQLQGALSTYFADTSLPRTARQPINGGRWVAVCAYCEAPRDHHIGGRCILAPTTYTPHATVRCVEYPNGPNYQAIVPG